MTASYVPTKLEIDNSLRSVYREIEQSKRDEIFGVKNWCQRHIVGLTSFAREGKLRLIGSIFTISLLGVGNAYLLMGAYGNFRSGSYDEPANMAQFGHVTEWIAGSVIYTGFMWKLLEQFDADEKFHKINEIYKKQIARPEFNEYQKDRLNELRMSDLANYKCYLSSQFLETEEVPVEVIIDKSPDCELPKKQMEYA
ncbi:MAG: hypothetical protein Tsb0015_16070 [Simkaniaceae bacterium]